MNVLMWTSVHVPVIAFDIGVKLVFLNVALNPVFYGLCRNNYRKGYNYVLHLVVHYLSCGIIHKPGGFKSHLFFEFNKGIENWLMLIIELIWNLQTFHRSVADEKVFFESKRRKQKRLQAAAEINMRQRMNKMRKRRISAHALQVRTLCFLSFSFCFCFLF